MKMKIKMKIACPEISGKNHIGVRSERVDF